MSPCVEGKAGVLGLLWLNNSHILKVSLIPTERKLIHLSNSNKSSGPAEELHILWWLKHTNVKNMIVKSGQKIDLDYVRD